MFNFQQEIEDQLREIREQYGDEVLKEFLDQDYYDGEYCNPPVYRWSPVGRSGWRDSNQTVYPW